MLLARNPLGLPDIEGLRRLSQSLAMLDAILCPEWEFRYHSFNAHWAGGEEMASMRNGSGDDYVILFTRAGAILKGFAHESAVWQMALERGRWPVPGVFEGLPEELRWPVPGVFEGLPEEFAGFLSEPAFSIDRTTFCLWRRSTDPAWQTGTIDCLEGKDPDGSADLLRLLGGEPEAYRAWAEDYFEIPVAPSAIAHIFGHRPLSEEVVKALNPKLSQANLLEEASEIAYPILV